MGTAMALALAASLMTISIGCVSTRVIPSDRMVVSMPAGKVFTPAMAGWFVPDALMLDIRRELSEKRIEIEKREKK